MEETLLEKLQELDYTLLNLHDLQDAISNGCKSILFTQLIEWLSKELQVLYSLDEHVNSISTPDDASSFCLELSSFLKEIGCQYSILMEGRLSDRFQKKADLLLLLNYLIIELKSARMMQANKSNALQVTLEESPTSVDLKNMLKTLGFSRPPSDIPPKVLFEKVESKIKEVTKNIPKTLYAEALFRGQLSDKQWHMLDMFYKELFLDYEMRREMLLKRLDVTIQSFQWSDRLKNKSNEIQKAISSIREKLIFEPTVRLSDILYARKDLAVLEKTSSASVRRSTKSHINSVLIGRVPDRGGRPYEQEPPPPEMPSWQKRSAGPPTSGPTGPKRGGFHNQGNCQQRDGFDQRNKNPNHTPMGGRVQAGWNAPQYNDYSQSQGSWNSSRNNSQGTFDIRQNQFRNQGQDRGGYSRGPNPGYYSGGREQHQDQGNRSRNSDYQNRYNRR